MHFAFSAGLGELFGGEQAFLISELLGKRTMTGDFWIERSDSHSRESCNDEDNHHAVGLVPNLRVLAAF